MDAKLPPMRRCVGCGVSKPKAELVRVACTKDGLKADPLGRLPGRGAYICRSEECLSKALKKGGFARSFRRQTGGSVLEELGAELSDIIKA